MKTGKKEIAAMVTAVLLSTGFAVLPMQSAYAGDTTINTSYGLNANASGKEGTALGFNATATNSGGTTAVGSNVTANMSWATAIGGQTKATGHASTAIGAHTSATAIRSIAIGDTVNATAENAIAMGAGTNATAANAIAIGANAKAANVNSVALGTSSVTGDAHTGTTAQSVTLGDTTTTFAGQASTDNGTVSVGQAGAERQVQNVAAGDISATSTDAINGSQLYATNEQVEKNVTNIKTNADNIQKNANNIQNNTTNINNLTDTVNAGWEAEVNGEKVKSVTPSDNKLNFQEGKNITITGSGSDITVATKDDVTFSTVKVGDTVSISKDGIDNGGQKITNVQDGTVSADSKDAVNGSQLYTTNEQVKTNTDNIKTNADNIQNNANNIQTNAGNIQTNATNISNLTDTVNAGWDAEVNGTKVKSVTPSSNKLNYVAGQNMTITGSGDDITIATKDDVSFNSIKAGDTVTINNAGIDAGNTKITNVQDGDVSADSKDAVNGGQLYSVEQDISNMGNSIAGVGNRINSLDKRVDKVGAGAAALAALHPLDFDPDDKWDFAAGYGHYNGRNAYALGLFYRPNEDTMLSVGSTLGNGENLLNAGLSLKFGQGNHVSTTRVAMAREMLSLRADNKAMHEQINAMNDRLNGVLGMLDMAKSASFPDVPENHWAYEAVSKLAGNGIIKGYPDGMFKGDRAMTRYEFASMLYRAMQNGATVDGRLLKEFKPELDLIRVDAVSKNIDRVRVNHK
ncbi:MAG: S-layer homology domain-containing protein [Megasphaera sp.]|jgi:autotransporter adhesin|nr:S-layer homology domain-containing protein [Megasphaera sp.]MCH4218178.1 S-layer homology domain-containing protein [Megasphaera sp.]